MCLLTRIKVVYREKWEFGKATLISWSLCTGLISTFDIVTTSLLAADFSSLYSLYNEVSRDHKVDTV